MSDKTAATRTRRRIATLAVTAAVLVAIAAPPAFAAEGGTQGPCVAGTPLEGETLGGDVSFVARFVGTPLPEVFAFDFPGAPPPMPPGQLLQFARANSLC